MKLSDAVIGRRVKTLREWSGVPLGSEGLIVEDYGSGVTVAWDLPHKPLPAEKSPAEIAEMWAVNPRCPLRDGFDKKRELDFLEIVS